MRHDAVTGDLLEQAALYALGALEPEHAAGFEAHLAEGCAVCHREVQGFAAVTTRLADGGPAIVPRPELRDRLLATLAVERRARIVRAGEGAWEVGDAPGWRFKRLAEDPVARRLTALLRMDAGARYPAHRHADTEELFVIDGDLVVDGHVLTSGDYCAALADSEHRSSHSERGCTFFVRSSQRDRRIAESSARPDAGPLRFILATEGAWREAGDGISIRNIFADPARNTVTAVVRMRPGSQAAVHGLAASEELYVLAGDAHLAGGDVLRAGDYCGSPGSRAPAITYSDGGCTLLVVAPGGPSRRA